MTDNVSDGEPCMILCRMHINNGTLKIAVSLSILSGFTWQVEMEGRKIPPQHFGSVAVNCVSGVGKLLEFITTQTLCCGNDDVKFLGLVNARKGKFKDSSGTAVHKYYIL